MLLDISVSQFAVEALVKVDTLDSLGHVLIPNGTGQEPYVQEKMAGL